MTSPAPQSNMDMSDDETLATHPTAGPLFNTPAFTPGFTTSPAPPSDMEMSDGDGSAPAPLSMAASSSKGKKALKKGPSRKHAHQKKRLTDVIIGPPRPSPFAARRHPRHTPKGQSASGPLPERGPDTPLAEHPAMNEAKWHRKSCTM